MKMKNVKNVVFMLLLAVCTVFVTRPAVTSANSTENKAIEALSALEEFSEGFYTATVKGPDGKKLILVTDVVYREGLSIHASVYQYVDGSVVYVGSVGSNSTAYPIAVKKGVLYYGTHHIGRNLSVKKGVATETEYTDIYTESAKSNMSTTKYIYGMMISSSSKMVKRTTAEAKSYGNISGLKNVVFKKKAVTDIGEKGAVKVCKKYFGSKDKEGNQYSYGKIDKVAVDGTFYYLMDWRKVMKDHTTRMDTLLVSQDGSQLYTALDSLVVTKTSANLLAKGKLQKNYTIYETGQKYADTDYYVSDITFKSGKATINGNLRAIDAGIPSNIYAEKQSVTISVSGSCKYAVGGVSDFVSASKFKKQVKKDITSLRIIVKNNKIVYMGLLS